MANIKRIFRHLALADGQVKRAFSKQTLDEIELAIASSERKHSGELRFVVEGGLSGAPLYAGESARERALDVFSQLRMWDTDGRNGVLIYLLMADHAVEIVADRGVNAQVGAAEWERICQGMQSAFHDGRYKAGVIEGIAAVNEHLMRHFPADGANHDELPNKVVVL